MKLQIEDGLRHVEEIKVLFKEYTDMLTQGDEQFKGYPEMQHYDRELQKLEEKYGPPSGCLRIAFLDGMPAGCVGLRRLDERRCEMKRLYVRPCFRSNGIGGALIKSAADDARRMGYAVMLLDTLPFLKDALGLYKKFGFEETARYNGSPLDTSIYMRLELNSAVTQRL